MKEPSFFTNYCPSCAGGIEFPADGVGQQIECPHCQQQVTLTFPTGQEEDPDQQIRTFLQSASVPTEESELLALSMFACPSEPAVLANPRIHYVDNEAEAIEVVERFLAQGLLQEASSDLVALLRIESSSTLKSLAKDRNLSCSGTKDTLAKRLAKADPEAMQALFRGRRFLVCSVKGSILVEKWQEADRHKKKLAETNCVHALHEGRLNDACLAVASYEATRLIPRGVGIDWRNYDTNHDSKILQTIFAAQLSRHTGFDPKTMATIRVAAAMIHLWGTNNPSPWLLELADEGQFNWAVETRMVLFYALDKSRIQDMREAGIRLVEMLGSGSSDDCPVCRSDSGKTYPIDCAPSLPHGGCTCEDGCKCMVIAKQ